MNKNDKIVIIGATSAIAEHCARLWVQGQPTDLTLVGRDEKRVERVATDLKVRSPQSTIRIVQADFRNPASINATVENIFQTGTVDVVLIALRQTYGKSQPWHHRTDRVCGWRPGP